MQTIGGDRGMRISHRTAVILTVGVLLVVSIATQAAMASIAGAIDAPTPTRTLVVDKDRVQCGNAGFSSIQTAVDTANPGDVVRVCPDVYDERVTVNKPLTIRGDANSVQALDCFGATRPALDPTQQVIVTATKDNPTVPMFDLQADNIDLQGFVLVGPGQNPVGPFVQHAVGTAADHSGYQVHHNLIMDNTVGIFTRSNGLQASSFDHNCLRENRWGTSNDLLTPPFDDGIVEPLINTRIHHNSTFQTRNVAFEVLDGSDHVTLDHNASNGDGFGYVFIGTSETSAFANTMRVGTTGIATLASGVDLPNSSLLLRGNTITGGTTGIGINPGTLNGSTITENTIAGLTGQGIVLTANNNGNTVSTNIVQDNGSNGIRLAGNNGNTVSANTVQGNAGDGIQLNGPINTPTGATNNTVSANTVQGNGLNGIHAAAGATQNTFTANQMSGNGTRGGGAVDARDDAFATNQNSWRGNVCTTDSPPGQICGVS